MKRMLIFQLDGMDHFFKKEGDCTTILDERVFNKRIIITNSMFHFGKRELMKIFDQITNIITSNERIQIIIFKNNIKINPHILREIYYTNVQTRPKKSSAKKRERNTEQFDDTTYAPNYVRCTSAT